jgi:hypothetical protein
MTRAGQEEGRGGGVREGYNLDLERKGEEEELS